MLKSDNPQVSLGIPLLGRAWVRRIFPASSNWQDTRVWFSGLRFESLGGSAAYVPCPCSTIFWMVRRENPSPAAVASWL